MHRVNCVHPINCIHAVACTHIGDCTHTTTVNQLGACTHQGPCQHPLPFGGWGARLRFPACCGQLPDRRPQSPAGRYHAPRGRCRPLHGFRAFRGGGCRPSRRASDAGDFAREYLDVRVRVRPSHHAADARDSMSAPTIGLSGGRMARPSRKGYDGPSRPRPVADPRIPVRWTMLHEPAAPNQIRQATGPSFAGELPPRGPMPAPVARPLRLGCRGPGRGLPPCRSSR